MYHSRSSQRDRNYTVIWRRACDLELRSSKLVAATIGVNSEVLLFRNKLSEDKKGHGVPWDGPTAPEAPAYERISCKPCLSTDFWSALWESLISVCNEV